MKTIRRNRRYASESSLVDSLRNVNGNIEAGVEEIDRLAEGAIEYLEYVLKINRKIRNMNTDLGLASLPKKLGLQAPSDPKKVAKLINKLADEVDDMRHFCMINFKPHNKREGPLVEMIVWLDGMVDALTEGREIRLD